MRIVVIGKGDVGIPCAAAGIAYSGVGRPRKR